MVKKDNKELLNEELKRHMKLVEYTFYVGEDEDEKKDDGKELILGEEPEDEDLNMPNLDAETGDEDEDIKANSQINEPDKKSMGNEITGDIKPVAAPEVTTETPLMDTTENGDEIELDVTQLVQAAEEAKATANITNQKMVMLINQFNELNNKLNKLEDLDSKIKDLEQEIIKRNPTQVEKLEMRSLNSFPYNLKLTDYWTDKESEGKVKATDKSLENKQEEPEEYELTIQDIEDDYNQQMIPNTFNPDEDNDELEPFKFL